MSNKYFWLYNLFLGLHAIKDSPSKWGYLQSWAWGQYLYLSRREWTQYCLKWKRNYSKEDREKLREFQLKLVQNFLKREWRLEWNLKVLKYVPMVPIVAIIGSKTPSNHSSSFRLRSCFSGSASNSLLMLSTSTGKMLAQLQVQVEFSAIQESHQEEGITKPPSLREMLIAEFGSVTDRL